MHLIEKLVTFKVHQLSILSLLQNSESNLIADSDSIAISLEIYRRHLLNLNPISQSWIQATLNISLPTIHRLVQRLIKDGFVNKKRNKIDKRKIDLIATPKLIVLQQTYIATLLLGMDDGGILKLSNAEKNEIKSLMLDKAGADHIFQGVDQQKLTLLKLWPSS